MQASVGEMKKKLRTASMNQNLLVLIKKKGCITFQFLFHFIARRHLFLFNDGLFAQEIPIDRSLFQIF